MSIQTRLNVLETSGLIRLARELPELEYLFRHSLVQEAAYQSLLKQNRRALHQAIGEALEDGAAGRQNELAPILAHHFYEAEDAPRALKYYVLAGDEAARKFATAESLAHYTRALEIARQGAATGEALTHIYTGRGRSLEMRGQYDEALANDRELETLAYERGDRAMELSAIVARSTIHSTPTARFDAAEAQALSERAIALANVLGDRKAEAKILWNLVLLNRFINRFDLAVEYGERSAALARELGLREQLAFTLNDMYPGYAVAGQMSRARDILEEAHGLWHDLGNLPMLADSLTNMAEVNWATGQYPQALAQATEALRINQSIGNPWGQSYSSGVMGMICVEMGEFDKTVELMDRAQRFGREAGFVAMEIMGPTGLALCMASLGAPARGLTFALSALDAADRLLPSFRAFPLAVVGWLYAMTGRLAEAVSAIAEARQEQASSNPAFTSFRSSASCDVAIRNGQGEQALKDSDAQLAAVEEFGLLGSAPDAWHHRGRALRLLGRTDEAYDALTKAHAAAKAIGWRRDFWAIAGELAVMAAERGDERAADAHRLEARDAVMFIAGHSPTTELRETFLALPDVRKIMQDYA
jgi:tetratricopeptide (TPR) repeat protein